MRVKGFTFKVHDTFFTECFLQNMPIWASILVSFRPTGYAINVVYADK